MFRHALTGVSISVLPSTMIKTIINSLRKEALPPQTTCLGHFTAENMRARILEVRDRIGIAERWIEVAWSCDGHEWTTLGLLRSSKDALQLDVIRRAQDYLRELGR